MIDRHDTPDGGSPPAEREQHLAGEHRPHTSDSSGRTTDQARVELREEVLLASTHAVEAGRVRVDTEVVTEHRTVEVPVTRSEVVLERHPVDRRPAKAPIGEKADAIVVPVHQDEVTVEKRPVVYEEVDLGKRAVQERQVVSDTVRKEVVDIDAEGDVPTELDTRQDRFER